MSVPGVAQQLGVSNQNNKKGKNKQKKINYKFVSEETYEDYEQACDTYKNQKDHLKKQKNHLNKYVQDMTNQREEHKT